MRMQREGMEISLRVLRGASLFLRANQKLSKSRIILNIGFHRLLFKNDRKSVP